MLKKMISSVFTIILMLLITALSSILVIRTMLYKNTINDMINIFVTNDNETINTEDIKIKYKSNDSVVEDLFEEVIKDTSIPNEIINYLETEELSKYINNYISQYMEYNIGMAELPKLNTVEFNQLIQTAVKECEDKTGNDINEEELNKIIVSIDEIVSKSGLPNNKYTKLGRKILRVCFDNRTVIILIILIILSLLIILLIKGIRTTLKRLAIIFIINSIFLTAISLALTFLGINEIINTLLKIIITNLNTIAYISFGIGLVIYILLIIIKPKKKEDIIEPIEEITIEKNTTENKEEVIYEKNKNPKKKKKKEIQKK